MKVLIAGHTYMVAENQKKLAALAQLPGVELAAVVPHRWHEPLQNELRPQRASGASWQMYPTRVVLAGNEMRYVYLSRDLHMQQVQPDVLLVENGAGAFAYTQFLMCRRKYAPRARAVFFTWWNLPYRARAPLHQLEQWNLRQTQGAIAGNQAAAAILRGHGYTGALEVLPQLGVDIAHFAPKKNEALRALHNWHGPVIGYAGRLVAEKGLRVLMRALEQLRGDFQLVLLGRGPLEAEIRAWAAQLTDGQRVHIQATVPHADVPQWMNAMDLLVLPSLTTTFWIEQFGHVLIEAMACGLPVVASDSGEMAQVVAAAGMVVPEGNVAALAVALQQLVDDAGRRVALGAAARARVAAHYTHAEVARKTHAFLQQVVAAPM